MESVCVGFKPTEKLMSNNSKEKSIFRGPIEWHWSLYYSGRYVSGAAPLMKIAEDIWCVGRLWEQKGIVLVQLVELRENAFGW